MLAGRMRDGARTYGRGELALADDKRRARPEAVGDEPCLCLVVQTGPPPPERLRR